MYSGTLDSNFIDKDLDIRESGGDEIKYDTRSAGYKAFLVRVHRMRSCNRSLLMPVEYPIYSDKYLLESSKLRQALERFLLQL